MSLMENGRNGSHKSEESSPGRLCGSLKGKSSNERRVKRRKGGCCKSRKSGHLRAGGHQRGRGVCPGADLYVVLGISTPARAGGNQLAPKLSNSGGSM